MDGPGPETVVTASAVAARLGVAVETLRTWDRRYGMGPTGADGRGPGGRRRYREADVSRLLEMRRLVAAGVPTADAALRARAAGSEPAAPGAPEIPSADAPARTPERSSSEARSGLLSAATALDVATLSSVMRVTIEQNGVEQFWNELLRPVLADLGERWATTGNGVEIEHLLSSTASTILRAVGTGGPAGGASGPAGLSLVRPPVVLAAVDGEQHVLVLDALAAVLVERGHQVMTLGASTPAQALGAVVRRTRPSGVFLWSRTGGAATAEAAEEMRTWLLGRPRRPFTVVVGGDGWAGSDLPDRVRWASSLAEARTALGGVEVNTRPEE